LAHDAQERFGLLKFYYCNACDRHLPGPKALCQNEGCQLRGVPPKRSKTSKRTSIFTVLIKPQLSLILERVLPLLTELHDSIHNRDQSDDNPVLSETSCFPKYDRDIESVLDFRDRKVTIVLTLNVDGVRFKKLSRSESWPVYNRLEGLPFKEKNKYENIILAGIMFTKKPPTETLLVELFSGLKHELEVLQREGIPIHTASDTWICTPKLVNGIIDFAALQTFYGLPRWQSLQGCHLCMFPGERVGRRVIWFNSPRNTRELTEADFPGVRDLGTSMKNLWYALDPTLITLKVHCLVDHAVLEELPLVGSPYHWSSSSFESIHRRLHLRVPQCTTNVEETIIEKCNVMVGDFGLEGDWYVPADSVLAFEGMGEEQTISVGPKSVSEIQVGVQGAEDEELNRNHTPARFL
uniref:DNA-directed DNA polymerase n=1 Tax=Heligmosomoides polygyrus TaxID=6339 RepID=A0A183GWS7_HELPZ